MEIRRASWKSGKSSLSWGSSSEDIFNKTAEPYLLSGIFLSEVSSGDEKGINFDQRGFPQLWCFHSSFPEAAKKYIIVEGSLHSSRKTQVDCLVCFFSKRNWSSQRLRKTSWFWHCLRNRSAFATAKKNSFHGLFLPDESKIKVVRRRLWSGILNPPDDFSQLSFLKTLLSRTEMVFPKSLLPPWDRLVERYCDQIQTNRVGKMLKRRWRFSSSGWDVAAAPYILGSAGFLIRMVSNK